jgi:hypothetical protein
MSYTERTHQVIPISFKNGESVSGRIDLRSGAFGTFLIPTSSPVIGKAIQITAVAGDPPQSASATFPETDLLSAAKNVAAAGAVSLTSSEIAEVAAVGHAKIKLSGTVNADCVIFLMWKS